MRALVLSLVIRSRSRFRVLTWMKEEWVRYADLKLLEGDVWSESKNDDWMRSGGISNEGDWQRQITAYWDRANAYGLDTLEGRQALMKSILTLVDCAASMIRVYGDPPEPGYPSGEIRPTHRHVRLSEGEWMEEK